MFGWLKRPLRRERELLESMARASAEGASRAMVNRALGSVGIQLAPQEDNTLYCVYAAAAIVRLITNEAGVDQSYDDDDDKLIAGIFSFVANNHLSRIVGANFEFVASIAPLELFGQEFANEVGELGNLYNKMASSGKITEAIGQNIAIWIESPTDNQMNKLGRLFKLCREGL